MHLLRLRHPLDILLAKPREVLQFRAPLLFNCESAFIKKFKCPEWDYATHFQVDFSNHMRRGHDWNNPNFQFEYQEKVAEQPLKCGNCDFVSFSQFLMRSHKIRCYNKIEPVLPLFDLQNSFNMDNNDLLILKDQWFYCESCNFTSKSKEAFKSHKHGSTKLFSCEECDYTTPQKAVLANHVYNIHTPNSHIAWFSCKHCPYKGKRKHHLQSHVKTWHIRKIVNCSHCGFKAHDKMSFKNHMLEHDVGTKVKEPHKSLSMHKMKDHTSNKTEGTFKCNHCPLETRKRQHLQLHYKFKHSKIQIPQGMLLFKRLSDGKLKCKFCSFSANSKSSINNHARFKHPDQIIKDANNTKQNIKPILHEKSKGNIVAISENQKKQAVNNSKQNIDSMIERNKTKEIEKTKNTDKEAIFLRKRQNIKAKSPKKLFQCDHCSHSTDYETALKKHVYCKHTPDSQIRWFKCDKCDYKAKRKDNYKMHLLNIHKEMPVFNKQKNQKVVKNQVQPKVTAKVQPELADNVEQEQKTITCAICKFEAEDDVVFKRHIFEYHAPNF